MRQGMVDTYNRLKAKRIGLKTAFLCPPKVNPCRIVDPGRLEGAFLYTCRINLNRGGKDMITQARNKGQDQCAEQMMVDRTYRDYLKRKAQEDAAKFREIVHGFRVKHGLEVSHA